MAGLCGGALCPLSSSCPLWLGSVSRPCPPLVLLLAVPLNSVAGLSVARFAGEECGRTNSDVNADKNSLMKQFALGLKVGRTKKSLFDQFWSKRIVLKLFGVYAGIIVCTLSLSLSLWLWLLLLLLWWWLWLWLWLWWLLLFFFFLQSRAWRTALPARRILSHAWLVRLFDLHFCTCSCKLQSTAGRNLSLTSCLSCHFSLWLGLLPQVQEPHVTSRSTLRVGLRDRSEGCKGVMT